MTGPGPSPTRDPVMLTHNRVSLALHRLGGDAKGGEVGDGNGGAQPLLLVHGLGERTPESAPPWLRTWPGPIWGLDLTGHGASSSSAGGGYTAEILMADIDVALAHLGPATLVGRGLGAYLSLLMAGARPDEVRGAVLGDGPGLAGGGEAPGSPLVMAGVTLADASPDPFALIELTRDVRPPDYALRFVRQAVNGSTLESPIAVSATVRPPWLDAVADEPGVVDVSLCDALALYARDR